MIYQQGFMAEMTFLCLFFLIQEEYRNANMARVTRPSFSLIHTGLLLVMVLLPGESEMTENTDMMWIVVSLK